VFDGQGGQIGIVDKVRLNTSQPEQLAEDIAVLLGRVWHPNRAATEPSDDLVPSLCCRGGSAEDARVRDDAQERQNTCPRQSDANGAV
jgi:hypothetical protein